MNAQQCQKRLFVVVFLLTDSISKSSLIMTFKFATWNVFRLSPSSKDAKADHFYEWLESQKPDVLGLLEVTGGLEIDKYSLVNYVNTLKSNDQESQLCIAAYVRDGSHVKVSGAKTLRITGASQNYNNNTSSSSVSNSSSLSSSTGVKASGQAQSRAQLKVVVKDGLVSYYFYILHANASYLGGIDGVEQSGRSLKNSAKNTAFAGDFNYDLNHDKMDILEDEDIQVVAPTETGGNAASRTHKNGAVYDFMMATTDMDIEPIDQPSYKGWKLIDHAPIIYEIG